MTADEVRHEIDGATEMFAAWEKEHGIRVSPSIHFTGGEPLLYQGLWKVVAHSRGKGYGVAIMTNGSLITKKDAEQASSLGVSDTQLSLEGPPDIHDSIRGRGSFGQMAGGLEHLIKAGNRVSANVTLSRLNASKIEETVKTARNMGFYGIGFSRVVPCGRGKSLQNDLLPPEEVKSAYSQIHSLNSTSFEVVSGDPLAGTLLNIKPSFNRGLTLSGCSAGFSGVTVTSDGSVMACRRIGLVAGNLKKKPLREIWASSELLWQLRSRENYRGKCGSCSFWPSCRGCRAVAYNYSVTQGKPDLFADDPQCWVDTKDASPWKGPRFQSKSLTSVL